MTVTLTICSDCDKEFVFDITNVKEMDTGTLDCYYSCVYIDMVTCPHCDSDIDLEDLLNTWEVPESSKYMKSTSKSTETGYLYWF